MNRYTLQKFQDGEKGQRDDGNEVLCFEGISVVGM